MGKINRRTFLQGVGAATTLAAGYGGLALRVKGATTEIGQPVSRECDYGPWQVQLRLPAGPWRSGHPIEGEAILQVPTVTLQAMRQDRLIPERWLCLLSSERLFNSRGELRLINGIGCSTFLTPSGLAVEGGLQGALSSQAEKNYRPYIDILKEVKATDVESVGTGGFAARFPFRFVLADDVPAGVIRLRFEFGLGEKHAGHVNHRHSLNGEGFARRQRDGWSTAFSAPVAVNMSMPALRIPWVLMSRWGSNGQRGIVAEEDRGHFALSHRHIAPAEPIFPLEDAQGRRQDYDVIPDIVAWKSDKFRQIEWAEEAGRFSAELQMPSGKLLRFAEIRLGTGQDGGLKSLDPKAGRWRAEEYGAHTVKISGYCLDVNGNRYEGGGTYRFWLAERLTVATATFLGLSFPVGRPYGAPIAINPALAGEVSVDLQLFPAGALQHSKAFHCAGRTTEGGIFGPAEGMKSFPLTEAGEYLATIRAQATDSQGRLWLASLTHAGIVFSPDTNVEARGKKVRIGSMYAPRGETLFEGRVEGGLPPLPANGKYSKADLARFRFLDHLNYPWLSRDVLLISSEGQGANKIEPVLTFVRIGAPDDPKRGTLGIGYSELQLPAAEGGWDPFSHPELVRQKGGYWYASAPRPGFMSRFMVATNGVFAPYWPTSNTNFGGQVGASANGDMAGDIYRLLGGVVVPEAGGSPSLAGYLSSAFILPAGSVNNRIIAPGSEDLPGADGQPGRFFLVAVRPGSVYGLGTNFTPLLQIDPVMAARVHYELIAPSGRVFQTEGTGNMEGYFYAKDVWNLAEPGVWTYRLQADFNGHPGRMPGLPPGGGWIFVTEKRNVQQARRLELDLPAKLPFDPAKGFRVQGLTTGATVFLSAVMPGCVIGQWEIPVTDGRFEWLFDPALVHARAPIYDIRHSGNGRAQLGRVVHLSFFTREGTGHWSWSRVVVRGPVALSGV